MENCFDKLLFVRTLPWWLTDRVGCVQVPFQSTVLIHHYIDMCASVQYIFFSFNISDNNMKWRPWDAGRQDYTWVLNTTFYLRKGSPFD